MAKGFPCFHVVTGTKDRMHRMPEAERQLVSPLPAASVDQGVLLDIVFLETWERTRPDDLGSALRVAQIRRANPELAAAIALGVRAVR